MLTTKTLNYTVEAGELEISFTYELTIGRVVDNFNVLYISPLRQGYDDLNNINLAIYPANIDITIDDFKGDNYRSFKDLLKAYSKTFPFNHDSIFYMSYKLNGVELFKGYLEELESIKAGENENEDNELRLTFVDGINNYKNMTLGNPYLLNRLYELGIMPRSNRIYGGSCAYGFQTFGHTSSGYQVWGIEYGDREQNIVELIEKFFRLLNPTAVIEFSNTFLFGDIQTITPDNEMVNIYQIRITRLLSNLLGRYVVLDKNESTPAVMVSAGFNYTSAELFELIYEDERYKTYYHNWEGNPSNNTSLLFRKGITEKTISDVLKLLALNLFSEFGFKDRQTIIWKHRRYETGAIRLQNILTMRKSIQTDKITGVKIKDYYTGNYGTDGFITTGTDDRHTEYSIPLNAVFTENGFEHRLVFTAGGQTRRVIDFKDLNNGYRALPHEVVSRAEYEAHKDIRDKYEITVDGVNINFYQLYFVLFENYNGYFKPIEIEKDTLNNVTRIIALEI